MTDHVIHECPKIDGREWGKSLHWPDKRVPLNKRRHDVCPYGCGAKTNDMESASPAMVEMLTHGRVGVRDARGANQEARLQSIEETLKELIDAVKKGSGGGSE